jgi:hypothetical protein
MAKFIANSAGYTDPIPPSQQTFTDVPNTYTFWREIERAVLYGVIQGYTDPTRCPETGVPCFRPQDRVTRGQTAKFVANSANYQDPIPPSQQTFTDVPNSYTFWREIERVALHGIVQGYTDPARCLLIGVPCFRPQDQVTRGQTAKFVSSAFFPNCDTPP